MKSYCREIIRTLSQVHNCWMSTTRNICAGGESVWIRFVDQQAMDIKFSFMRSIYIRLFSWLVQRMSQNTNWRGRKRTYLIDENTSSRSSGSSSTDQASPVNDSTEILTIVYWTFLALSNCVLIVQMNVFRLNLVTPSLVTSSNCMVQKELNGERYNVRVI